MNPALSRAFSHLFIYYQRAGDKAALEQRLSASSNLGLVL